LTVAVRFVITRIVHQLSNHRDILAQPRSDTEHVSAVAFSRTGDPATGDFSDAKVIRKFGDVPDDLSAL